MRVGRKRGTAPWALAMVATVFTLSALVPAPSWAAREPQPSFTAYFSWPDISGTSTVNGQSEEVDVKYSDVVENFDTWRVAARLERWQTSSWGYYLDGMYSSAEAFAVDENEGLQGTLDFRRSRVEAAALYRFGE